MIKQKLVFRPVSEKPMEFEKILVRLTNELHQLCSYDNEYNIFTTLENQREINPRYIKGWLYESEIEAEVGE